MSEADVRSRPVPGARPAGHPRQWAILAVLMVSLIVVMLDNTVLNVALPTIQERLGATQSQQEWFIDGYTLVFAALLFPHLPVQWPANQSPQRCRADSTTFRAGSHSPPLISRLG